MNLHFQNTTTGTSLLETITNNLCMQIMAFQQSIQAREAGSNFPTIDETNQLVKLVNILNKLYKQQATDAVDKAFQRFARFVKNNDPAMATAMGALFQQFTGGTPAPVNEQPTPAPAVEEPPLTDEEFQATKHLLSRQNLLADKQATTPFRGREANTNWLQFNLFQKVMPPDAQNPYMYENKYHYSFDHNAMRNLILNFLEQFQPGLLG